MASGLWKIGTDGKPSVKVSSDDWSGALWKCAVNFGKHCYVHTANAIYHVDLTNGSWSKINSEPWDGSMALAPLPDG